MLLIEYSGIYKLRDMLFLYSRNNMNSLRFTYINLTLAQ